MKNFSKNDNSFICENCNHQVDKLSYTSRDHCNNCLCSLHVDNMPGDRLNSCHGLFVPIDLEYTQNKGYVIVYKCNKCGQLHKNKVAKDDNNQTIAKIANKSYNYKNFR